MKNLFDYDGLLATAARNVWKLFMLNVCFVVCSLPVFTIGAATAALYGMFLNEHMESGVFRNFFREFKSNFRRATLIWLVFLAVGILLVVNHHVLTTRQIPFALLVRGLTLITSIVYLLAFSFVFPLQAHFDNTVGRTIKNSVILGMSMPLKAGLMAVLTFLPVIVLAFSMAAFIKVMAVWLLFGFAVSAQINSFVLKKIFEDLKNRE